MGKGRKPSPGVQGLGLGGATAPQITVCFGAQSHPRSQTAVEEHKAQRGCATRPRAPGAAGRRPPRLAREHTAASASVSSECGRLSPCRLTFPCCRGSSCTVPAWPSRPPPSTWPSTSSSCWTPTPPPPSTPRSSFWRSTRMAREGRLTGTCGGGGDGASCGQEGGRGRGAASPELPLVPQLSGHPAAGPTEHGPTLLRSVACG